MSAAAILSDDDKQRLTEKFGACNWQLLDAAYQKGMEAAACICEAWAEQHRIDAQETVDENCDFRIAAEDCAAAIRSALAPASTERSEISARLDPGNAREYAIGLSPDGDTARASQQERRRKR